jgi:hypothetical protein
MIVTPCLDSCRGERNAGAAYPASPDARDHGPHRRAYPRRCRHEKGADIAVGPRSPAFDPSALPRRAWPSDPVRRLAPPRPRGRLALRFRSPGPVVCIPRGAACRPRRPAPLPGQSRGSIASVVSSRFARHPEERRVRRPVHGPHRHRPEGALPMLRIPSLALSSRGRSRDCGKAPRDLHPTGSIDRFPNGTNRSIRSQASDDPAISRRFIIRLQG